MAKQQSKIKSSTVDTNNYLNEVFSSFDSLKRNSLQVFIWLILSLIVSLFILVNPKDLKSLNAYWDRLDNIYKDLLIKQDTMLIISNASIKNNNSYLNFSYSQKSRNHCQICSLYNQCKLYQSWTIYYLLWQPLDTQGLMISLTSKPQRRSIMWEFTRELDKEPLLN